MQFIIVTEHDFVDSYKRGLGDMTVLSIPAAFLVSTGCKDKEDFAKSIVHVSFDDDTASPAKECRYNRSIGTLVFRHLTSLRSAVMTMVSDKVMTASDKMICIHNIHNIRWKDNETMVRFLGMTEARLRLGILKHAQITRNGAVFYAVPLSNVDVHECIKDELKFLKCEFGVNVAFKEEHGSRTQRSILFPTALFNVDVISHEGMYAVINSKDYPTMMLISPKAESSFGVKSHLTKPTDLMEYISQFHTATEMARIKSDVMNNILATTLGDVYAPTLEFVTPTGPLMYKTTMTNIGRSCMVVVLSKPD